MPRPSFTRTHNRLHAHPLQHRFWIDHADRPGPDGAGRRRRTRRRLCANAGALGLAGRRLWRPALGAARTRFGFKPAARGRAAIGLRLHHLETGRGRQRPRLAARPAAHPRRADAVLWRSAPLCRALGSAWRATHLPNSTTRATARVLGSWRSRHRGARRGGRRPRHEQLERAQQLQPGARVGRCLGRTLSPHPAARSRWYC